MFKRAPHHYLLIICAAHLLLWPLVCGLLQSNGALDVVEAIAWGSQWQLGYDRDPYLVAWLAKIFSMLGGGGVWPVYVLSQLCVVITFIAVWCFAARLGLSAGQALLAVLLLEGIYYYHFTTPEFNDNVLQLPLWAWVQYQFYCAVETGERNSWLRLGLLAGLALMAKYFAIFLLAPLGLWLLLTKAGRQHFKHSGPYLALVAALVVIWPNMVWQYQHDWLYVSYALSRTKDAVSVWQHLGYPLKFALGQVAALLPAVLLYFLLMRSGLNTPFTSLRSALPPQAGAGLLGGVRILTYLTWSPFITVLAYSLITGSQLRSMWGTPLFSLFGLWLVYHLQPTMELRLQARATALFGGVLLLSTLTYAAGIAFGPTWFGYAKTEHFPSQQFAQQMSQIWENQFHQPLGFVAGDRHLTARLAVYAPSHPTPLFDWSIAVSPWVDDATLIEHGALMVWKVEKHGKLLPPGLAKRYPGLISLGTREVCYPDRHIAPMQVGVAVLPPRL